jgi:hypothetical protein
MEASGHQQNDYFVVLTQITRRFCVANTRSTLATLLKTARKHCCRTVYRDQSQSTPTGQPAAAGPLR